MTTGSKTSSSPLPSVDTGITLPKIRDGQAFFFYKRLERGTFQLLTTTTDDEGIELEYSQLVRLLGGLDLRTGRRRKRYRRVS